MFSTSLCGVKSNAHKHTRHTDTHTSAQCMWWTFNMTKGAALLAEWHSGIFSVTYEIVCVFKGASLCASVCVCLYQERIQLSMTYLRSHSTMWNPSSTELLWIPEPQGFSLWWQLSTNTVTLSTPSICLSAFVFLSFSPSFFHAVSVLLCLQT